MPTITVTPVRLYAHCKTPLCPGYRQEEVDGVRQETGYAFNENGGDIPGIERSFIELNFAEDSESGCASCGNRRELSAEPRPSYDPLSGHDPMGLLSTPAFDVRRVNTEDDARVAELEAKIAAQDAKIDRLLKLAEDKDA